MRRSLAVLLVLLLLGMAALAQERGRRRSRAPDTFHTAVEPAPFDIVLARPRAGGITVSVRAAEDCEAAVEYGVESGRYSHATPFTALAAGRPGVFEIEGLEPTTRYYYRLKTRRDDPSEESSFRTGRSAGAPFTFTMQADSHLDANTSTDLYQQSLQQVLRSAPDFHVDLGDTFMTDKRRSDFQGAEPQYRAQRTYLSRIANRVPLFLVLGNHDGEGARRREMSGWAREQRTRYFPSLADPKKGEWYSWTWGDALFVALDPFWATGRDAGPDDRWARTLGEEQYRWLRKTLESSEARFKFVFIHHLVGGKDQAARGGVASAPYFEWGGRDLDGTDSFDKHRPGWGKPIHRVLVDTGVAAVFHGHDHLFVREELDGVVYQLVPQPGLPRNNTRSAAEYGYTQRDVLGGSGIVRVRVRAGGAEVELVRPDAEVAYGYTIEPRKP